MDIRYSKTAAKYLNSLDRTTKLRIKEAVEKLPLGDVVKLQGIDGYRLRVGNLRIIFEMEADIIFIDNILPRGQVYKRI